ncbi:dihydroxyacetone kinase family protein [Aureimonas pseudogalii]|uniref:Dihydroxyacetone kinase n=1 Tax=Aureimonas pseudogalii TaxID=1744844 RepID=A0A7W6EFK8_9HYPH|nr:dihydroxyacetone kinase family protein [Aureimonas pseudogalii]MBB3998532.1 dihydroxyacetone kinase [Aureimonas pseudogalii]
MTAIFDEPERFAATALQGFCDVHARLVRHVPSGAVRASASDEGKVAVVIGGGSGHYPAFLGYVGPGFADAAVAGDVFASPSTQGVARICRLANRGGGIVLGFGNYAGDVLNFGAAATRLRAEGIDVRILAVTDDVASAPAETPTLRRGVAGDVPVFKIAGAAAEAGHDLDAVERLAQLANARTQSFGIAFAGCRLPGADGPLFTVAPGTVALGLGIHGEPGIRDEAMMPASKLADLLVTPLLAERPAGANGRVAAILNGLGATKYEELFVLWTHVAERLRGAGLTLVEPEVGEFVTSLDMAGCSLTLTWLDDELEPLWRAPADTATFRRGTMAPREAAPPIVLADETRTYPPADRASKASAAVALSAIEAIAAALKDAEVELGRIDAIAGDGDHGQGMRRGSQAAATAAREALAAGAGAGSLMAAAGDAWADTAGGTSGAIWGLLLRAWGGELGDAGTSDAARVAAGAKAAAEAVTTLGRAKLGDKTLVDALLPFVETLGSQVEAGTSLRESWAAATDAAAAAADATAALTPRLGRARPLAAKSLGHPDAGAVSLALVARTVAACLSEARASPQPA